MKITHAFVSSQPQGSNPDLVSTSEWNADHIVSGSVIARVATVADLVSNGNGYVNVNPDPTTHTLVPGMTVTFTLAASVTALVRWYAEWTSSGGGSRGSLWVDGAMFWPPEGSNGANWILSTGDGWGYARHEGQVAIALASGSHTIEFHEEASGSTSGKTWFSRFVEVTDIS